MPDKTFTDLDRRTLANLSIPRNVENLSHELRVDPYTQTRKDDDVHEHLQDLEALGMVHKLGEHDDPAKLAASLPPHVRQMPDDQAEIYARRMSNPRHQWRMRGDLWVITHDGVERLHQPNDPDDVPEPLPLSSVQAAIDSEWARTLKGTSGDSYRADEDDDRPLAHALLEDEFLAWAQAVADDCERRWGKRPKLPLAGGAGWTDVFENRIIDQENQKTLMPALVDPWFMALTILAFTDTDTPTTANDGTHVPTYTGYARKSVAGTDMNVASSGSSTNANAIIFAACTAGSSTIVGFANCQTSGTTGDLRKYGTCASTTVSTTQTPAQFAVGAYTTTAD